MIGNLCTISCKHSNVVYVSILSIDDVCLVSTGKWYSFMIIYAKLLKLDI